MATNLPPSRSTVSSLPRVRRICSTLSVILQRFRLYTSLGLKTIILHCTSETHTSPLSSSRSPTRAVSRRASHVERASVPRDHPGRARPSPSDPVRRRIRAGRCLRQRRHLGNVGGFAVPGGSPYCTRWSRVERSSSGAASQENGLRRPFLTTAAFDRLWLTRDGSV